MLGKSVISEAHPLFVGIYEGAMGREEVTRFVEDSDCVILLGAFMTDINLGIFTANLDPARCIYATSEQLRIRHHHFHDVLLGDFMRGLAARRPQAAAQGLAARAGGQRRAVRSSARRADHDRAADRPAERNRSTKTRSSSPTWAMRCSPRADLVIRGRTEFLCPAYYTSMGFGVPAALGAGVARPDLRPLVLVGDGAFQMTGMELSTIVRHGFDPIVIVLDNKGYGTERFLHPGDFNDIHPWNYHKLPEVLGGGTGYEVRTEGEFDAALRAAWADHGGMSLIQVHLSRDDCSAALKRLCDRLSKKV